ncbi:hypothetical protein JCM24511_07225 [Saitozyma sp. JCM 24511]|nr:hypothetical protein JCM24511_07225 [Saitozyma sp. JCM 24511]
MSDYLDRVDRLANMLDQREGTLFPPLPAALPSMAANATSAGAKSQRYEQEDPVNLSVLSLVEAESLVRQFHEHLNPLIAVLDSRLHTTKYLRESSTILFTSVLAAASKFYRKDLHHVLMSHAKTIVDRAVIAGAEDTALVQSLMVLIYWKEPTDTSAWRKIGWAIRMGFQFHWHLPRLRPLPEDELAARQVLDSERTWICFDRGFSTTFNLPPTIRPHQIGDVRDWAQDHPQWLNSIDTHLVCIIECGSLFSCIVGLTPLRGMRLKEHWQTFIGNHGEEQPSYYREMVVSEMESRVNEQLIRWFGPSGGPPGFLSAEETRCKWVFLDLLLAVKRYSLAMSPQDPLALEAALSVAVQIVQVVEKITDQGKLQILQDLSSTSTSVLCIFLRRIFQSLSPAQKSTVVALLRRLLECNTRVSNGDEDSATAIVARFIRRVLVVIGAESRSASRPASPPEGGIGGGGFAVTSENLATSMDQSFFNDLDEFAGFVDDVPDNGLDEQYWALLFGTSAFNTSTLELKTPFILRRSETAPVILTTQSPSIVLPTPLLLHDFPDH